MPDDLRMIRLVFDRLGLRSELDGDDVLVPGGQKLVVARDVGEYKIKVQDGPVARVPGRPDVDRRRAGHPVRRARCSSTSGCSRTA